MDYRPISPDLSSFNTASPANTYQQHHPPGHYLQSSTSSYAPQSPNLQPLAQCDPNALPYQSTQPRNLGYAAFQQPRPTYAYREPLSGQSLDYDIPSLPPAHDFTNLRPQQQYLPQQQQQQQQQQVYSYNALPSYPSDPGAQQRLPQAQDMSRRVKHEGSGALKMESLPENKTGRGPSMGIEVKTKFPVARIKRIMQADEEVGKVAQVTPVAVSKALELFMISLVTKSADLARAGNGKRVTAQHLKKAIEADEQFDFLGEIVAKVVEGPEAGGKKMKDDDDSSDIDHKPARKRGGRKKKE